MIKYIDYIYGDSNSSVLELVHPGALVKTAEYSSEIVEFIKRLLPKDGVTYALMNALSAGEYYGSNRNGDYFPEDALIKHHHTFQEMGHVYEHHVNKDPARAYGTVPFSFYNPSMHRVELIVEIENNKARPIIDRLEKGELPAVSMGTRVPYDVCLSTETLLYNENGLGTLAEIEVGDKVFTHTGTLETVEATSERVLSSYIKISIFGDYYKLSGSHEHPMQIVRKEQFVEGTKNVIRRSSLKDEPLLEWAKLDSLRVGDYLVFKKTIESGNDISTAMARILGYYLSEGFIIKQGTRRDKKGPIKNMGVGFSFNINEKETFVKDLTNCLDEEEFSYKLYENIEKHELRVSVYSKELASIMLELGQEYSKTKSIHPKIFSMSNDIKFHVLGSAINGDGSQDHNSHCGTIRYNSVSESLARGIRRLCFELGIPASINKRKQKTSFGEPVMYTVHIPSSSSELLSEYSEKIITYNTRGGSRIFAFADFMLIPITGVKEIDDFLLVKNLQVKNDESYQVLDYVSHNCSICGHKAKTRAEYCEHLLNSMNRVLADGKKVYAINLEPKFFDISFVTIPADRTAGVISRILLESNKKANYTCDTIPMNTLLEKTAAWETVASINKEVTGKIEAASEDPKKLIISSQKRLSQEQVEKLSEYPMEDVLSTLSALRIMPMRDDFQKLALYNLGYKKEADDLEKEGFVFDIEENEPGIDLKNVSIENYNEKIALILGNDIMHMANTKPLIISRILVKEALYNEGQQNIYVNPARLYTGKTIEPPLLKKILVGQKEEPLMSPVRNPALALGALGALYVGLAKYQNAPNMGQFKSIILKYPWIAPIFLATIGGLLSTNAQEAHYKNSPLFAQQFSKTASALDKYLRNIIIAVPPSYYFSYKAEEKARRGEPITGVENFIRKHPLLVGVASGIGGTKLLGRVTPQLTKVSSVVARLDNESLDVLFNELTKED